MATPWEMMKQQPIGNALGKQSKLWSKPQSFKSMGKLTNNIIGTYTLKTCHCEVCDIKHYQSTE
jgi:hypothetical protein